MSYEKYTFDNVFQFATSAVVNYFIGMFAIVTTITVFMFGYNARQNWQIIDSLDIVNVGEYHTSTHYRNGNGSSTHCFAVNLTNPESTIIRGRGNTNLCNKMMAESKSWRNKSFTYKNTSFGEKLMWTIILVPVFLLGTIILARIPAALLALIIPPLQGHYPKLVAFCMIPAVLSIGAFVYAGWTDNGHTRWKFEDDTVTVTPVYQTSDGKFYARPTRLWDWTDRKTAGSRVATEISQ